MTSNYDPLLVKVKVDPFMKNEGYRANGTRDTDADCFVRHLNLNKHKTTKPIQTLKSPPPHYGRGLITRRQIFNP